MEDKKFSTREWFFVLILISMTQGFIWYISFVYSANGSALTYVSFAGTLISIILAVLAIGYTYGESLSQKNKSDNVSSQIAVLNEVIKNIHFESQSLEQISTISEELTRFASTFEDKMSSTQSTVKEVSTSLASFLKDYDRYDVHANISTTKTSKLNKKDAAESLMKYKTPLMEICILFIIVSRDKTYKHNSEMIDENVIKYIERAKKDFEDKAYFQDGIESLFTGGVLTIISILKGLELISGNENNRISISNEFIEVVKRTAIANPASSGKFYAAIREEVIKDLNLD